VAARSKARNVISIYNTGVVSSHPTLGMNVCLRFVIVLSRVGKGLAMSDPPSKESSQLSLRYIVKGQSKVIPVQAVQALSVARG
jgi:hypothetical protein